MIDASHRGTLIARSANQEFRHMKMVTGMLRDLDQVPVTLDDLRAAGIESEQVR